MKATELRIGNFLKNKHIIEPVQVSNIDFQETIKIGFWRNVINETMNLSAFEPILITEEWLEKLGLEKSVHGEYWNLQMIGWFTKYTSEEGVYSYNVGQFKVCDFKYVHDLQNLYYSITGNELPQVSEGKK